MIAPARGDMRDFRRQVAVLGTLHELASEDERASAFRRGMASLAQAALDPAAAPFAGCASERLLSSVQRMLASRLLDDLDFLRPAAGSSALYALAGALPAASAERRELGRRLLKRLALGDAESFVTLSTALALGSTRAFESPSMRARIELMLKLPDSAGVSVDPLALALLSRRELCVPFVVEPASADLPARRMAARVLERAARHAALRAKQGDDGELSRFEVPHVQEAFTALLSDREPWVLRHVASARGMLAGFVTRHAEDLERDLMASHAPSRVRRGAISLAAKLAVLPGESLARARELLRGAVQARDPGFAAALIAGLPRAIEVEREAGEQLLADALRAGGALAAEVFLELRRELQRTDDCAEFAGLALAQLDPEAVDPAQQELVVHLREMIERPPEVAREHGPSLPALIDEALRTYAQAGPADALAPAQRALSVASAQVERLALIQEDHGRRARRELLRLMAELDQGLLGSSALFSLLSTSERASGGEGGKEGARLTELMLRLLTLLIEREARAGSSEHLPLRMRRLRLLLHLIDSNFQREGGPHDAQLHAVRRLGERVAEDGSTAMDRLVHASLARGFDALVRGEALELADAVLCAAFAVPLPEGLLALADGCLLPDLRRSLRALHSLSSALEGERPVLHALSELAHALPSDTGPRTEALRRALLALSRSLEALTAACSIRQLLRSRRALTLFEGSLLELAYLAHDARRRLGAELEGPIVDESPLASLTRALESAAAQNELSDLGPTLDWLERELLRTLPRALALAVARVLEPVKRWPLDDAQEAVLLAPASAEACPLPPWMPASRRLGGFAVSRPLGTGLGSSVFVVRRVEQRHELQARALLLKVPRYDSDCARVLTEADFELSFARELPALLRVPPHENLASVVAVEPALRPKPFLVMEYVEGPTLSRVRKRLFDAFAVLDGILAGLEVLHEQGVAHLDLTPSHVVLRVRNGAVQPVLVDYQLAGEHVRPGCGDACYRAPELWREAAESGAPADVYALGCLAYELVTGRPLFHAHAEGQLAALHCAHDGTPPELEELLRDARLARLADWMALCLRADPRQRATASELRAALKSCFAVAAE
jgi:serine/threonine protein kinase